MSNKVSICVCASRAIIDKSKAAELASILDNNGYQVDLLDDMCRTAIEKPEQMAEISSQVIMACYPRTITAMFGKWNVDPEKIFDIRSQSVADVCSRLNIEPKDADSPSQNKYIQEIESFASEQGADAWYPIIDKQRCGECEKCFDFCLFGVYATEDGRTRVKNPTNCKNNCPACARICPFQAIIFPKHEFSPINGGEQQQESAVQLDNAAIYNQALREKLNQRRKGISLIKRQDNED